MAEADDIVAGTIVGIELTRRPPRVGMLAQLGPFLDVTGYRVKLDSGAEVKVDPRLPSLKHSWMCRKIRIGMKVKVALGSVLEPMRIVDLDNDA
jgi:hypothetical protein